jgi:hypothetical protein
MSLDLSTYTSVQTNVFVKLVIPNYDTLYFSDYHKPYVVAGDNYDGLGSLLSFSSTDSSLRATPQSLSLSISGIPQANIDAILTTRIKGSQIILKRVFFNPVTGIELAITGNPAGKFRGIVSNFEISDDLDIGDDTGSYTLLLVCSSVVTLLQNKIAGRKTNPIDQKIFYPTDESMDRVPRIVNTNFNFGAPQ